jgi:hypothetical protein
MLSRLSEANLSQNSYIHARFDSKTMLDLLVSRNGVCTIHSWANSGT